MQHEPVLMKEVLEGLDLSPGAVAIDATLGLGGHSQAILEKIGSDGMLIAFERDARNLEEAKKRLAAYEGQVTFIHDSFATIAEQELPNVDAILFDVGISSPHVDQAERGFSFQKEGALDMRFDQSQEVTAETIVNGWAKDELAELFRVYGDEPRANTIAKAIFNARRKERIITTTQLADVVSSAVRRSGKAHPATRVFQAIRMAVNDELGHIERALPAAVDLLKPGGRIAVISFHSLEDRLVKRFLRSREDLTIITKKPIKPSFEEQKQNPRSRSAKLRIAQKIGAVFISGDNMNIQGTFKTMRSSFFRLNFWRIALALATVTLGVLYIWQVNVAATRGFSMRDLERDIEELQLDNDRLQMDVAHLQSTQSVTTRMKMLGLTQVSSIEYVTSNGSVAINR